MSEVSATSTTDTSISGSTNLPATVFAEVFILPDTGEIFFIKEEDFEESVYDNFYSLLETQKQLAEANEKVKETAQEVDDEYRRNKETAADEFKKNAQVDMDEELASAQSPQLSGNDQYNNAINEAEEAFIACDEAVKKATGSSFSELVDQDEDNDLVEIISLTQERPLLLPAPDFDNLSGRASIVEKMGDWNVTRGTDDNDFMGLVRSLKGSDGNFDSKTIKNAFQKVNGSIKLAEWTFGKPKEGNASFGSEKLASILKNINDNAEVSTDKDKKLLEEIVKVLDDAKREVKDFTVDNAEFVLQSLRSLYSRKNDKAPETDYTRLVTNKLGEIDESYSESSSKTYTIKTLTDDDTGDDNRKSLLSEINKLGTPPKIWDATASAKVLRYSATAGGSATTNLKDGVVDYTLKAEAKFDLVDAKAETNCYLPSDKGFNFCFDAKVRKIIPKYKTDIIDDADAAFFHDSSFVSANAARGLLLNLSEAQKLLTDRNVNAKLAGVSDKDRGYVELKAHADKSGAPDHNQLLSTYRALAAFAFIYKDVDGWFSFFKKDIWGQKEADYMLKVLSAEENPFGANNAESEEKLKLNQHTPFITSSLFSDNMFFSAESSFFPNSSRFSLYPFDKYQQFFCQDPIGEMQNFGAEVSLYDENSPNWEAVIKNRIQHYFEVVHNTIERFESLAPIKTSTLLITRANIKGVGESEASLATSERNFRERNIQVICKSYESAKQDVVDGTLDFGHIRLKFNGYVNAWAGVQASVTAGLSVKSDKLMLLQGLQPTALTDEEKADAGSGAIGGSKKAERGQEVEEGANLGAAGEAFAGAKAEAGVKTLLEWLKPAASTFAHLAEAGYSISGSAGAGASADFKIGYDARSGKFVCKMKAEATLGVGCGGAFSFAVSLNNLVDFVQLVYSKLKDVDFSFLDIFETRYDDSRIDVYQLFSQMVIEMIKGGHLIGAITTATVSAIAVQMAPILKEGIQLVDRWQASSREEDNLKELAETVEKDSDIIKCLTPETKGRILYLLTKHSISSWWEDVLNFDWNYKNEELALKIIEQGITSQRDYMETLAHMADFSDKDHLTRNRNEVNAYVSGTKSVDDEKDDTKIANKRNRILANQDWLKIVLFPDKEDLERFDEATKKYQI